MQVIQISIPDVVIIELKIFGDDRGFFFENFNQKAFNKALGQEINFVQGAVIDVVLDIRQGSKSFG